MSSQIITYKFRIKDSVSGKKLDKMAAFVNMVWNYCNETSLKAIRYNSKWLTDFDLNNLTSGCGKELGLHSQTVQSICKEYVTRRKQFKKRKLNWRSAKRSLGWIPFKASGVNVIKDTVQYNKQKFKFWKSRTICGPIKSGSFNQDSKGRWYVNLTCELCFDKSIGKEYIGIDLGLKTQLTLSNGNKYSRESYTKKYQDRLAMAQRANKKKQTRNLHAKIANQRKDWNHKVSTEIIKSAKIICVGDVSSKKLTKTKMAKSTYDAGWYQIKSFLKYKAIRLGVDYRDVNESWTTRTCSSCFERSGPQGLSGLSVREWVCSKCGSIHDRDTNAAKNILRLGHETPIKGIPRL